MAYLYTKNILEINQTKVNIPQIECRKGMLHNWSLKMPNIPKTLHDFQAAACLQATATTRCNHQGAAEAAKLWCKKNTARLHDMDVSLNGGTQQPLGFPNKNDHFGMFWGYHHWRKHPYGWFHQNHNCWIQKSILQDSNSVVLLHSNDLSFSLSKISAW